MAKAVPLRELPDETINDALDYLVENLREADLDEIRATTVMAPREAVQWTVGSSSVAWLILDSTGLPIGIMGAAPGLLPGVGVPWLVGTDGLEKEPLSILRQTKGHVDEIHELFPVLTNFVDARNDTSLDWLLWAGFRLLDANTHHGPEGRLFLQFYKSR